MQMKRILLMNGPNLDMLGIREPDVYGSATLRDLEDMAYAYAQAKGISLFCFQSNSESELIGKIHGARGIFDGIVYNPGAHTHYSYALRDAIGGVDVPVVEVHISDVDAREPFRAISVIAPACVAQVKGLGFEGYCRAIDILCEIDDGVRLGEGYENRYPAGTQVIVAARGGEVSTVMGSVESAPAFDSAEAQVQLQAGREEQAALTAQAAQTGQAVQAGPVAQVAQMAQAGQVAQAAQAAQTGQAGQATQAARTAQAVQVPEPQDYTEPFAADVAAESVGDISFGRLNQVSTQCSRMGISALLVRDTSNIRWLTAFDGVFDEERAHALVVTPNRATLHTDSRYSNAMRTIAERVASDVEIDDTRVSHADFAKAELSVGDAPFSGRLGIEDTITYSEFVKVTQAFDPSCMAATSDLVLGLRSVKDAYEINRLRAAQAVTDAAFAYIVGFMRPGMTEREVQIELEHYMLCHGGEGLAFSSIVATGANGADPHAIPGSTRLEAGQCVVMDFGAKAFGYCSDMTRVVFLGQPEGTMAQAWEVLRRANETVEAMLRPGVTGMEAHETAERVLAEGGFAGKMGHGLGHGVGIDVHELPVLNSRNGRPLVEGNVVTVEPGIYLPGEFGMRLEDCGVITAAGYKVFSNLGHDMVVI